MGQHMAIVVSAGVLFPAQASNSGDPSTFLYQLGAFGVAVLVAWWLLGRSDRAMVEERADHQKEIDRVLTMLAEEQKAHSATRELLYQALKDP